MGCSLPLQPHKRTMSNIIVEPFADRAVVIPGTRGLPKNLPGELWRMIILYCTMGDLHNLSLTCVGIWALIQSDKTLETYKTIAILRYWDSFKYPDERHKFGIRHLWLPPYYFYSSEEYQPREPLMVDHKKNCSSCKGCFYCSSLDIGGFILGNHNPKCYFCLREYGVIELAMSCVCRTDSWRSDRHIQKIMGELEVNVMSLFDRIGMVATLDKFKHCKDNSSDTLEWYYTYKLHPKIKE